MKGVQSFDLNLLLSYTSRDVDEFQDMPCNMIYNMFTIKELDDSL